MQIEVPRVLDAIAKTVLHKKFLSGPSDQHCGSTSLLKKGSTSLNRRSVLFQMCCAALVRSRAYPLEKTRKDLTSNPEWLGVSFDTRSVSWEKRNNSAVAFRDRSSASSLRFGVNWTMLQIARHTNNGIPSPFDVEQRRLKLENASVHETSSNSLCDFLN